MTSKKVYVLKKLKIRNYYIRVRAINGKKNRKMVKDINQNS